MFTACAGASSRSSHTCCTAWPVRRPMPVAAYSSADCLLAPAPAAAEAGASRSAGDDGRGEGMAASFAVSGLNRGTRSLKNTAEIMPRLAVLPSAWPYEPLLGRELETPRLALARLPAADGHGLVGAEHPLARIGRGALARVDGVEAVDRQRHGHANGIGIAQADGVFPPLARLDIPASVVRVAGLGGAVHEQLDVGTGGAHGRRGHHGAGTGGKGEAGGEQIGDSGHQVLLPVERRPRGFLHHRRSVAGRETDRRGARGRQM